MSNKVASEHRQSEEEARKRKVSSKPHTDSHISLLHEPMLTLRFGLGALPENSPPSCSSSSVISSKISRACSWEIASGFGLKVLEGGREGNNDILINYFVDTPLECEHLLHLRDTFFCVSFNENCNWWCNTL